MDDPKERRLAQLLRVRDRLVRDLQWKRERLKAAEWTGRRADGTWQEGLRADQGWHNGRRNPGIRYSIMASEQALKRVEDEIARLTEETPRGFSSMGPS
jgi:hypothetical protein